MRDLASSLPRPLQHLKEAIRTKGISGIACEKLSKGWIQSYGIPTFAAMDRQSSNQSEAESKVNDLRDELRELIRAGEKYGGAKWGAFALKLFRFQAKHNVVYGQYVALRGVDPEAVQSCAEIPFLPVETFQSHAVHVYTPEWRSPLQFRSSGTSGSRPSVHHVDDVDWYHEMALKGFELFFGKAHSSVFLGVLPGYLERNDSSLVDMVRHFMLTSGESSPETSFFMRDWPGLESRLNRLVESKSDNDVYLIGVTHALLQWVEALDVAAARHWSTLNLHVVETGGMKGQGPELVRSEVHDRLGKLVSNQGICSEYGMTELLSQAWSKGNGLFKAPSWMHVLIGSLDDPREWKASGQQGRLHIIDLANIASCAFLASGDIGRVHEDGTFEVLGRYDHAEVRGCNLMAFDV